MRPHGVEQFLSVHGDIDWAARQALNANQMEFGVALYPDVKVSSTFFKQFF